MELHFFTGKQAGFEQAAAIRQAVFVEEQGFHNEFDEIDETFCTALSPMTLSRSQPAGPLKNRENPDAGSSAGLPSA